MAVLTKAELEEAAKCIGRLPPGIYTSVEIYGDLWIKKSDPTDFGRRFVKSVTAGLVGGIVLLPEKTSDNKRQYEVVRK